MAFQIKYNASRAEDILNGIDPVVFAGATAIRGTAMTCVEKPTTVSSNNKQQVINNNKNSKTSKKQEEYSKKSVATTTAPSTTRRSYFCIRPERFIDVNSNAASDLETATKLTSSAVAPTTRTTADSEEADPRILEALSRGFAIRRPRHDATTDQHRNQEISSVKVCDGVSVSRLPAPQQQVLLTHVELQRLQTSVVSRHSTASRTDAQTLFDKLQDRLGRQRIQFVNQVVAQRRKG